MSELGPRLMHCSRRCCQRHPATAVAAQSVATTRLRLRIPKLYAIKLFATLWATAPEIMQRPECWYRQRVTAGRDIYVKLVKPHAAAPGAGLTAPRFDRARQRHPRRRSASDEFDTLPRLCRLVAGDGCETGVTIPCPSTIVVLRSRAVTARGGGAHPRRAFFGAVHPRGSSAHLHRQAVQ